MADRTTPRGELGRLVQKWIDERDFPPSDAELGKRLGVSRSQVGRWLAGTSRPGPTHLDALHELTRFHYDELLRAADADARVQQRIRAQQRKATRAGGVGGNAQDEAPPVADGASIVIDSADAARSVEQRARREERDRSGRRG